MDTELWGQELLKQTRLIKREGREVALIEMICIKCQTIDQMSIVVGKEV